MNYTCCGYNIIGSESEPRNLQLDCLHEGISRITHYQWNQCIKMLDPFGQWCNVIVITV